VHPYSGEQNVTPSGPQMFCLAVVAFQTSLVRPVLFW